MNSNFFLWSTQFLLFLSVIFFSGANTPHGLVTLGLNPTKMAQIFGWSDQGSYLSAALDLIKNGQVTGDFQWVLNLWPPGMVWLDALLIRFSPLNFGTSIGLLTCLLWATAGFVLLKPFSRNRKLYLAIILLELLILSTSPFQEWMFDEGLFYADGMSAGLLLIALGLAASRFRGESSIHLWVRDGVFVGLLLAGAVYFRSSYQFIPWAVALSLFISVMILTVQKLRGSSPSTMNIRQPLFFLVSMVCLLLTLQPYWTYVSEVKHRSSFVMTEDLFYESVWKQSSDDVPQWLLTAGSNFGCNLDPITCKEFAEMRQIGQTIEISTYREHLFKSVIENPAKYIELRASTLWQQWLGNEVDSYYYQPADYESGSVSTSSTLNQNPASGYFYLATFISFVYLCLALIFRKKFEYLFFLLIALALIAPLGLAQIEVRYLIPIKLLGLLSPVLFLTLNRLKKSKVSQILKSRDETN